MSDPLNPMAGFDPLAAVQVLPKISAKPDKKELEGVCRDFESIFVNYLMQQMRETIPEESMFGGGQAEKIYTGLLDTEVSKMISQQRGIGLAALMYAQMSAMDKK
jgi:flagellar protein FlgJ